MDVQVAEDAARARDVRLRRRRRIVCRGAERRAARPSAPLGTCIARGAVAGVEAPLESDLDEDARPARPRSIAASSAARSSATGFSQNAGSPALAASRSIGACVGVGVAITSASMSASSCSTPADPAPSSAATAAARPVSTSATTTDATSGSALSVRACAAPIRPTPITPTRRPRASCMARHYAGSPAVGMIGVRQEGAYGPRVCRSDQGLARARGRARLHPADRARRGHAAARARRAGGRELLDLLDERGIALTDDCSRADADIELAESTAYTNDALAGATVDALQLFMAEIGRYPLLTAAEEVELAQRIERGDPEAKDADDQLEPAPRRLDRAELPGPRADLARPDPGRDHRADPRGREVRLAQRVQVLDVRDVVDQAGGPARRPEQVADDPDSGARGRARAEGRPRRARAPRRARPAPSDEEVRAGRSSRSSTCAKCTTRRGP